MLLFIYYFFTTQNIYLQLEMVQSHIWIVQCPRGPDFANHFLLNLSAGCAGDLVKRICFCLGNTSTCKSTIVKACANTFGKFVGTFNSLSFAPQVIQMKQQMKGGFCLPDLIDLTFQMKQNPLFA